MAFWSGEWDGIGKERGKGKEEREKEGINCQNWRLDLSFSVRRPKRREEKVIADALRLDLLLCP